MYSSSFTYSLIARSLHEKLSGLILSNCFSNDKDEIVFHFEGKEQWQLSVRFGGGEMFFFLSEINQQPGRNGMKQFKSIENMGLKEVCELKNERAFYLRFENNECLYFKGFGKFGNVLLYEKDNSVPTQIFRLHIKNDLEWPVSGFKNLNTGYTEIEIPIKDEAALKKQFPHFNPEILSHLSHLNFFEFSVKKQNEIIAEISNYLSNPEFFVNEKKDPPALCFFNAHGLNSLGFGMQALQNYALVYLNRYYFLIEKEKRLQTAKAQLKHFEKLAKDNELKLTDIQTRRSYKELGDIILSYAHSIKPGVANALLQDYYTGNPIRIKLDPKLNAAENAEKYYRKAKNQPLELKKLEEQLHTSRLNIEKLKVVLQTVSVATDFKGLKGLERKEPAKGTHQDSKPYHEVEFSGYTIWVGKNARSNDGILKLAAKNDLWLHARGVAGSHVIVRKKGNVFPDDVIQRAATLAAENSKAKNQKLVPVLCVERKFVVKPKNARPGEVVVLKEASVDAVLE